MFSKKKYLVHYCYDNNTGDENNAFPYVCGSRVFTSRSTRITAVCCRVQVLCFKMTKLIPHKAKYCRAKEDPPSSRYLGFPLKEAFVSCVLPRKYCLPCTQDFDLNLLLHSSAPYPSPPLGTAECHSSREGVRIVHTSRFYRSA